MSHAFRPLAAPAIDLQGYFDEAANLHPSYRGQLEPEFQEALWQHHRDVTREDCAFNHTTVLADGEVIEGDWDLRDSESAFLGGIDLGGKRVIEYGPASGGLSGHISGQGAELVVFDLPFDTGPEMVPQPDIDLSAHRAAGVIAAQRLRNAWWFTRRERGFDAQAVYADIYAPPDDLGRFDVAVFASRLPYLSNPFRALQQAAEMTDDAIIVTDIHSAPSGGTAAVGLRHRVPSLMVFNPTPLPTGLFHWWALSPELIAHMLRQVGFTVSETTTHSPSRIASRPRMFTVVARRARTQVSVVADETETLDEAAAGEAADALDADDATEGTESADETQAEADDGGLPVPPPQLRFLVSGTEDLDTFLLLGRRAHNAMIASLEAAQVDLAGLGRVLDFGCGVGRVTRHWKAWTEIEVFGTDVDEDAIEWDLDNLPFATFDINGVTDRLPYPDGHFGLIHAMSVFTHLPIATQMHWFEELVRLLRPDGTLYFTAQGQAYAHMLDGDQLAQFESGHIVVTGDDQAGLNHCSAFHPPSYVMNELLDRFGLTLVEFTPCGARGNPEQDSYLLRKAGVD